MSTDPDDPIVDRSSLNRIVEYFHDRSGVLCLGYLDVEVSARQPSGSSQSRGDVRWGLGEGIEKGELILYLAIEEVFWKAKSQGEYREQQLPNSHCRVTREANNN